MSFPEEETVTDDDFPPLSSEKLEWQPEFLLGIEQIDAEHQHLVNSASVLHRAVTENHPMQEVELATTALLAVTRQHFESEERLMIAAGYDEYASHKAHHDRLIDQLCEVELELATGRYGSHRILRLFLEVWTIQHILVADRRLAEFLKQHATNP